MTTIFLSALLLVLLALGGLAWWWLPIGLAALVLALRPDILRPARTATGSTVLVQPLGFRRYLQTTEVGSVAPEVQRGVVNRYLPYAFAFGLAGQWVGRFAAAGVSPGRWFTGDTNPAAPATSG